MNLLLVICSLAGVALAKDVTKGLDKKSEKRGIDHGQHSGAVSYSHVVQSHHPVTPTAHHHYTPAGSHHSGHYATGGAGHYAAGNAGHFSAGAGVGHYTGLSGHYGGHYGGALKAVAVPYPVVTPVPYLVERHVPVPVKIPVKEEIQPVYVAKFLFPGPAYHDHHGLYSSPYHH